MAGNCAIFRSWNSGDTLTASDLTTSMTTIGVVNMTQTCIDDYAVDTNQFRSTADPYPAGVASLPTSGAGELERLRYAIKRITGWSQWYTHTESMAPALGTITADMQVYGGSVTWNNAGVPFTAIKLLVTDSASAAASKLIDLQVGGVTKFNVTKAGDTTAVSFSISGLGTGMQSTGGLLDIGPALSVQVNRTSGIFIVGAPVSVTGVTNGDIVMPKNSFLRQPNKDSNNTLRLLGAGGGAGADYLFLSVDGQQTRLGDTTAPSSQLEIKSTSATRTGLSVFTAASPSVSVIDWYNNSTQYGTIGATATANQLSLSSVDLGSGNPGAVLLAGRNTNATNGAGYLGLVNRTGTQYSLWVDAVGALRYGTALPSNANDLSGNVILTTGVSVLDRVSAATTVANTTTETTVYTFSVPGGSLSTNRRLRLQMHGAYTNTDVVFHTLTVRLKYGSTTLVTAPTILDIQSGVGFMTDVLLSAGGTTSDQRGIVETNADWGAAGYAAGPAGAAPARCLIGSSTEDSTAAQNLVVTVQWDAVSVGLIYIMRHAVLELL